MIPSRRGSTMWHVVVVTFVVALVACTPPAANAQTTEETSASSSSSSTSSSSLNLNKYFDDFPGFRFTPWSSLPNRVRDLALTAGYTATTWDRVGTAVLEREYAWDDLSSSSSSFSLGTNRTALEALGFTATTWDCYMNHYNSYSWTDLILADMHVQAEMLTWTPSTWDAPAGTVTADSTNWQGLTKAQQRAAVSFCYWSDTWDNSDVTSLDKFHETPILYPWFRYQPWEYLTPREKSLADLIGWDQTSWNAGKSLYDDSESDTSLAFADLTDEQRSNLMDLGFYEEQYDCWINHYEGYSWSDLQLYGLAGYFETFGFTADNFLGAQGNVAAYQQADWNELSEAQKEAAYQLCWFEELWDEVPLTKWGDDDDTPFPHFRFKPWDDLTSQVKYLAVQAGYDQTTWNEPGTAELERKSFDDLTRKQQDALQALGFYSMDQYDCWVNHYSGYDWADLVDLQMDGHARDLGWDQDSWDGDSKMVPLSETLDWDDLTEDLKEAADHFCYFYELWDRQPLTIWEGVAWPELRYYPWVELDEDEKDLLAAVGYLQDTWDAPETASLEDKAWSELKSSQRVALREYGFYEAQWDCYVNHYRDYDWFELVLEGVAADFETLGWTQEDWYAGNEPPSYTLDYDDLTESQQDALWDICYFRETWNGDKLIDWDDDVRSGAAVAPDDNSQDESDDYDNEDEDNFGRNPGQNQKSDEMQAQESSNDGPSVGLIVGCIFLALLVGFACGRFSLTVVGAKKTEKELPKEGPVHAGGDSSTEGDVADYEAALNNTTPKEQTDEEYNGNYDEDFKDDVEDVPGTEKEII